MPSVIKSFQAAVDAHDVSLLAPLLHPDVRLLGSVRPDAFQGRDVVLFIFGMLTALIQKPHYVSETVGADGLVLLMHGELDGQPLDGIQVLTFDEAGLITQFLDFVRPLPALIALQDAATAYLAERGM